MQNNICKSLLSRRTARGLGASVGFSLIELLVVLVILGILAAVAVVEFGGQADDAKVKATKASIGALENAVSMFKLSNGRIPTEEEGLRVLYYEDAAGEDIKANGTWKKLLQKPTGLKDAWGKDFIYQAPGQLSGPSGTFAYDIISYGSDGKVGGEDKYSKDLSNHDTEMAAGEGGAPAAGGE